MKKIILLVGLLVYSNGWTDVTLNDAVELTCDINPGPGAETLLGKGDCLLETSQSNDLTRIQSPLTDDHEVTNLIKAIS